MESFPDINDHLWHQQKVQMETRELVTFYQPQNSLDRE